MRASSLIDLGRKSSRLWAAGLVLSLPIGPSVCFAQQSGGYAKLEIKLENQAISAAAREKANELKNASADISKTLRFYNDYLIPVVTHISPANVTTFNSVRRNFDEDIDQVGRAPKAFREAYASKVLVELAKVSGNKTYSPAARTIAYGMAMQLYTEPATSPLPPSGDFLRLIAGNLVENPQVDALQYLSIDALDKILRSPAASSSLAENHRNAFCTRLTALLQLDPPYHRQQNAHYKVLERTLLTVTTIATKGAPDAASTKLANEKAARFIFETLTDYRATEWLKEICCLSLGQLTIPQGFFSEEEAVLLENEIAAFAIKSLKDWRIKIARTGAAMGSMGMDSYSDPTMMADGYDPYAGGPGGPGGPGGGTSAPQSNVSKQPVEVKNARRMLNQRLERIRMALNGTATPSSKLPAGGAKKGLVGIVPTSEELRLAYAIEMLDPLQTELNSQEIADMNGMTTKVLPPMKEFRLACVDISGDRMEDEGEYYSPFGVGNVGMAPPTNDPNAPPPVGAPNGPPPNGPPAGGPPGGPPPGAQPINGQPGPQPGQPVAQPGQPVAPPARR